MATEQQNGATVVFEDGTSETWVAGKGVGLSSEAIAEFLRICMKPEPSAVIPIVNVDTRDS